MKNTKKLILSIVGILVLVAAVIVVLVLTGVIGSKDEEYRVVAVESYEGEVQLERNSKSEDLFEGMHLKTKDKVSTGAAAEMLLLADSDKHILARENTCFTVNATGDSNNGKIVIDLEYGTALITIDNKLADGSEFEVDTPNATMSVRGTTFEVTYNKDTGETLLTVKEGCVEVVNDILSKLINAGESVTITDDEIIYIDGAEDDTDAPADTDTPEDTDSQEDTDNSAVSTVDPAILADGVDEEEWTLILKNEADISALEYCLGIMTKCKTDGHENYVAEALIDIDAHLYYKEPLKVIGNLQHDNEWYAAYNIPKLNNVFGIMPNGVVDESNIPEDAYIQGNELNLNLNLPAELCVREVDVDDAAAYITENYYLPCPMNVSIDNVDTSQANKIIVEYTYVLSDDDGNIIHEKSSFKAYLEPDESGRFVITSIEKN